MQPKKTTRLQNANPESPKIKLRNLRRFYSCKLYHTAKDILIFKEKLGHRNIQNTMIRTRLVDWEQPDAWIVKRSLTTEEDQLIEVGFDYVRFDDHLGTPIYRKRK